MQTSGGFLDAIMVLGGLAATWLAGDAGRVAVASGMGGMMRWLSSERRRIRDGVIAIVGGGVTGTYFWPAVLVVMGLEKSPDNIAMAAFVAGTLGVSLVKIVIAVVETRARKWGDQDVR